MTSEPGQTTASHIQAANIAGEAGAQLILKLHDLYGWGIFRSLFDYTRKHKVRDWTVYAEPLRTAIVVWFLSYAAGTSLLDSFNAAIRATSGQTVPLATYQQAQASFPLP